jgi:NAD+ synthase (glutamine-hydrolysing)
MLSINNTGVAKLEAVHFETPVEGRVALAQITTDPGQLRANMEKIVDAIERARREGAELVVFPELCIPAYSHMDLIYNAQYRADQQFVLEAVCKLSHGIGIVVGYALEEQGAMVSGERPRLYNALSVFRDGECLHTVTKELLPNYGIHSERRYYTPGSNDHRTVQVGSMRVGLSICEDIWTKGYDADPVRALQNEQPDIVINASASPFAIGKLAKRIDVVAEAARRIGAPIVYTNLVGAFDGFDAEVVFDGRSMLVNKAGELTALGSGFTEELMVLNVLEPRPIMLPAVSNIAELHDALVLGIREYFRRNGFSKAYIGLSGGIDSALVAALAVEALGSQNVVGVTMPSHVTSQETKGDAFLLAENLGIPCLERSIRPEYDAWLTEFRLANNGHEPDGLTKQNKQARIRGTILMEYTNEDRSSLVITTGNKTELALGYCTLYGDMCGGFAAISDVDKSRVYELSRFINRLSGQAVIPETTLMRVPSAELEEGQTDAQNLPADYDVLVPLVNDIVEGGKSREELIQVYPVAVVDRTLRMIDVQEYKRRQAAPGIRVTERAFGIERRVPMGQGYRRSQFDDLIVPQAVIEEAEHATRVA